MAKGGIILRPPQANLFTMAINSSAYPTCGWDFAFDEGGANGYGVKYTAQRIAGGAHDGGDSVRITHIDGGSGEPYQYYNGWRGTSGQGTWQIGHNESIFIRFRIKPQAAAFNFSAYAPESVWTEKMILFAEPADPANTRCIMDFREASFIGGSSDDVAVFFQRGVEGGGAGFPTTDVRAKSNVLTRGAWSHLQFELHSCSADGVQDGYFKCWHNNNTYASPTDTGDPEVLEPDNWNNVRLGAFANTSLNSSGLVSYEFSAFEVARTFSTTWYPG